MTFPPKLSAALVALLLCAFVASCGNDTPDLPPHAVAKTGDTVITKRTLAYIMALGASFTEYQADKKLKPLLRHCRFPQTNHLHVPSATGRCRAPYERLKRKSMAFVLQSEWLRREAAKRGVKPTPTEAKDLYKRAMESIGVKHRLPVPARIQYLQYRQFQISKSLDAGEKGPTPRDLRRYYAAHRRDFYVPTQRDLLVIRANTLREAKLAKREAADGRSWALLAKRFSNDEPTRAAKGRLPNYVRSTIPSFDKPLLVSKAGDSAGPIRVPEGWWIFKVTSVRPATQQTLEQVRPAVQKIVDDRRRARLSQQFPAYMQNTYQPMTVCAAGYTIRKCSNDG